MARTSKRFRRGDAVRLREIPGLVGHVVTDLSGCAPPMVQISFGGYMVTPPVVEAAQVERVEWDAQAQDWRPLSSPACDHDWRQVELDGQECIRCGASRQAISGGYDGYLF